MTTSEGPLTIELSERGLVVVGEIDAHTAPMLSEAITADERPDLELDMTAIEFIDSSGLRVLILAHQNLEGRGGILQITNPSPPVKRLFEISGVDEYLSITG